MNHFHQIANLLEKVMGVFTFDIALCQNVHCFISQKKNKTDSYLHNSCDIFWIF